MPDITGALTAKLGPAPVWMWLAGGGIGLWLLTRSGALSGILPGSSGTGAQTAAGQATAAEAQAQQAAAAATGVSPGAALQQEIGLLQQLQQFQQQSYQNNLQQVQQTQQTTQAINPTTPTGTTLQQVVLRSSPRFGELAGQPGPPKYMGDGTPFANQYFNWGQTLTVNGPPGINNLIPVTGPGGQTNYVSGLDVDHWVGAAAATPPQNSGGGRGGPAIPERLHARTGRPTLGTAHPVFRAGHPFLKFGDVTYPASRRGGPRSVIAAASQAGVHPARILAVNHHAQAGQIGQGDRMHVA